jgi:hypothetical protein
MRMRFLTGILVLALLVGIAGAETFVFEGTTSNGEYSGTLVINNDGSKALSLAAVSDGTMSSPESTPLQLTSPAPEPDFDVEPMVSQNWTFDVENGEGFAGCSMIGASGDQAWTAADVAGTQATLNQEVGIISLVYPVLGRQEYPDIDARGVYAYQELEGGTAGSSMSSETAVVSATGDQAGVAAGTDGSFELVQGATTGRGSLVMDPVGVNLIGALAGQAGNFGSDFVENGAVSAFAGDGLGNTATTSSSIVNGTLYFAQLVGAGSFDLMSGLRGPIMRDVETGEFNAAGAGAFALQMIEGEGVNSFMSSTTGATSAGGDSAGVQASAFGTCEEYIEQIAIVGTANADMDIGNGASGTISGALAGQYGEFWDGLVENAIISGAASGAQGNTATTSSSVENGTLAFQQLVGAGSFDLEADPVLTGPIGEEIEPGGIEAGAAGAFALQMIKGQSYDSDMSSTTGATSSGGANAQVQASSSGSCREYITQFAIAGNGSLDLNLADGGNGTVSGALAGQSGEIEGSLTTHSQTGTLGTSIPIFTNNEVYAGASCADSNGNTANVFSTAMNGSVEFGQLVTAGQITYEDSSVQNALALQESELTGTSGEIFAGTQNAAGGKSLVDLTFDTGGLLPGHVISASAAGSGTVNSPYLVDEISSDTISGTGAGLIELNRYYPPGTDYNLTAYANLEGYGSDSASRIHYNNPHYAYAFTGLGDFDAKIGNH